MKTRQVKTILLLSIPWILVLLGASSGHAQGSSAGSFDSEDETVPCYCPPCVPSISGNIPKPNDHKASNLFSHLLWQTFIALTWPADTGSGRGVPQEPDNSSALHNQAGPRVWQTWKQSWELFQENPSSWDSYEVELPPCDFIIDAEQNLEIEVTRDSWPAHYAKYNSTVLDFINLPKFNSEDKQNQLLVTPAGPLIDQQNEYIRIAVRYNQVTYDCAAWGEGTGCSKNEDSITFPAATKNRVGAINLKAAWARVSDIKNLVGRRFSAGKVLVTGLDESDPTRRVCHVETRALVGMDISYKDEYIGEQNQNLWAWGAFEHRRNAPRCTKNPYLLSPPTGYSYRPQPIELGELPPPVLDRPPVTTCRLTAPPQTADCVNATYWDQLDRPWNQYLLVGSQWMLGEYAFPENHVASTVMETYVQKYSCIGCHTAQSDAYDHVWSITLQRDGHLEKFTPFTSRR